MREQRHVLRHDHPRRIADPGSIRSQYTHAIDVAATVLDLVGVEFPAHIDGDARVNSFRPYFPANADPEKFPVAHLFLNRIGQVLVGQSLSRPWRATKLETRVIGLPAKGLFLHIETVMPRRRDPAVEGWNDAIAPNPGFSARQYDRLAILYIALSVRAGACEGQPARCG